VIYTLIGINFQGQQHRALSLPRCALKKLPLAQTVDDSEALLPWNIELGAQ
jgi:inhibitor of KinA sporulation pathway (predicted exonuclease)